MTSKRACIYGKAVCSDCPVIATLKPQTIKHKLDPSKYVQPNSTVPKDVQEIMREYSGLLEKLLNQRWSDLAMFCKTCPQRILYLRGKP